MSTLERDHHDDRTRQRAPAPHSPRTNLTAASPAFLHAMVKTFTDALLSAKADALCNAEYDQVSEEKVKHCKRISPARVNLVHPE
ncbi:hypothetical protein [Streptomyces sp. NBC_01092]|uniref:hypothetical protein n=1 Tax=Streptomyces sp. NBC_01092 TaxID=2903748 RepID=UPI0038681C38|nr:hypothetical protein OG254_48360 [Streptomyces sp. NBC_01092]